MVSGEQMFRPCLDCGCPVSSRANMGARCEECAKQRRPLPPQECKPSSSRRGYGCGWRRLSREARRVHPFCMDCGTAEDLTADHLRWPARSLADVEVVCRSCNSKRGALRSQGAAVSIRTGLHDYAERVPVPWGGNPNGGSVDPLGGAPLSITLSGERGANTSECNMHGEGA